MTAIVTTIGGGAIRLGEAQASPKQRRRRLREVHLIWKKVVNLIFNVDTIGKISVDFSSILSLLLMKINKMIKKRLLRKGKYDAESWLVTSMRVENVFLVVLSVFYLYFCLLYSSEICFRIFVFLLNIFWKINITVIFFIILQILRKVKSEANFQQTTYWLELDSIVFNFTSHHPLKRILSLP